MNNGGQFEITDNEIKYLNVNDIYPNPYQPRRYFDRQSLIELSESIKLYGVMQPVSVRRLNEQRYELVAGERRLRASKMAGLETIPAIVVAISDQKSAVLAMIENLQRKDLNYLEEAEGYFNLLKDYSLTQEELAEKIGKSQSAIANRLRLLRLSSAVKKKLIEYHLTERHARALLAVENEADQLDIIERIANESLTVKETEYVVERELTSKKKSKKPGGKLKVFIRDIRIFKNTIKEAVEVMKNSGVNADFLVTDYEGGCDISIRVLY
ncbi:MAG: ParB/RepB/Spo0J family partition protein [Clostridiales bacterium]|jgi:ParB family chromosome partitioning protein|nr:ParB/RepB/Spo0J family partition protein [Clostridiales bacterium]